ncbi:hypothetical protein [Phenylobacterium soli]|uniref:Phosphate starvation-inducible protein PsiF n=1 Tax=Phenylobacterium soli TaxID=2170551 RepID=A0A328ANZ8_9CAUL|nr:hypothetical protein [Phenylobacterium soli]RAK54578.1 hypothetical protein DJ017_08600 [Phenylobacterium soli]
MIRLIAAAALVLTFAATEASAKTCRDAAGKFTKCPAAATAGPCRDKTTKKFAKCDAPNAERMPMAATSTTMKSKKSTTSTATTKK